MKTSIINPFTRLGGASRTAWILPALIAVLNLIPAGRVTAQTFTVLHSFTALDPNYDTNTDGAGPLVLGVALKAAHPNVGWTKQGMVGSYAHP